MPVLVYDAYICNYRETLAICVAPTDCESVKVYVNTYVCLGVSPGKGGILAETNSFDPGEDSLSFELVV